VLTLRRATQAFAAAIGVGLILVTLACSDVGDSSAISSEGDGQGQLEDATAPGDENSSSSSTSEAGSEESSPSTTPEAGSGGVDAGSDSSTGQPPGLDTGTTPVSEAEGPDDSGRGRRLDSRGCGSRRRDRQRGRRIERGRRDL
jgi:hypothetical protein